MNSKIVIYQILPRLFGNQVAFNKHNGNIDENGCGKFNDISLSFLQQLKTNGYTHVWVIGILAHASTTDYSVYDIPKGYPEIIKGKAGSPYAIRDYYDVDPDLAEHVEDRMGEFEALIDRIHRAGLKLIIDHIPNHLARNYQSVMKPSEEGDFGSKDDTSVFFKPNNNFYYLPNEDLNLNFSNTSSPSVTYYESPAKATGNDCFSSSPSQYDWYETVKLNYGVDYSNNNSEHFNPIPDTWKKMKNILLFWASKGVDGFRCDMAEMVPAQFWHWVIPQIKKEFPDIIFIAEIYNPRLYRLYLANNGFDYLYDKVGLYDCVRDVACGYRPASDITFALNDVGDIQHRMLNFLENHDEQRIASDYFLGDGSRAKAAMIVTACINKNPLMIYFGQELGEEGMDEEGFSGKDGRTTIFDYWSVDKIRRWNNNGQWDGALLNQKEKQLCQFYNALLRLCQSEASLREGAFYDLMPANYENDKFDSTKQYVFLRGNKNEVLLILANFSFHDAEVEVTIPFHAWEFFGIKETNNLYAIPLLDSGREKIAFSTPHRISLNLPANAGQIYKICAL